MTLSVFERSPSSPRSVGTTALSAVPTRSLVPIASLMRPTGLAAPASKHRSAD